MLSLFCFASFSSLCFCRSRGPSFDRTSICRRPDSHTCYFLFCFCLFGDVAFSEYLLDHCRFIFVWKVRRMFFPSGWYFSTLSPRAGFFTSAYVRIESINKKIYRKPHMGQIWCAPFLPRSILVRPIGTVLFAVRSLA